MSYESLAYVYDSLMDEEDYIKWRDFTYSYLKGNNLDLNSIVDLGCGTGRLAKLFAKDDYMVTAVDYSVEMLSYAEQDTRPNIRNNITWMHQDICEIEGVSQQDLVVSFCDVINYVTDKEDIESVFKNVYDMLSPGGIFMFDVHSLRHVKQDLHNQTFALVDEDVSYIWFCQAGDSAGEMFHDLTIFMKNEDKYERFDEFHHECTFSIEFYKKLLEESGFEIDIICGDFDLKQKDNVENADRIFIIAKKGVGK